MRQMAKETHIKTDKNPLLAGVLGSYLKVSKIDQMKIYFKFEVVWKIRTAC
jgi:hypothetical protein